MANQLKLKFEFHYSSRFDNRQLDDFKKSLEEIAPTEFKLEHWPAASGLIVGDITLLVVGLGPIAAAVVANGFLTEMGKHGYHKLLEKFRSFQREHESVHSQKVPQIIGSLPAIGALTMKFDEFTLTVCDFSDQQLDELAKFVGHVNEQVSKSKAIRKTQIYEIEVPLIYKHGNPLAERYPNVEFGNERYWLITNSEDGQARAYDSESDEFLEETK